MRRRKRRNVEIMKQRKWIEERKERENNKVERKEG